MQVKRVAIRLAAAAMSVTMAELERKLKFPHAKQPGVFIQLADYKAAQLAEVAGILGLHFPERLPEYTRAEAVRAFAGEGPSWLHACVLCTWLLAIHAAWSLHSLPADVYMHARG